MGIYIPNMERPESCFQCFNYNCDHWGEYGYDNSAVCPLIEIEDTEYEWCRGCKERDEENHCCHRWSNTIRNTVAELEEHYGKYITKHDKTLVIDYPDTDDVQTIIVMDDEGFTRVFEERRADD